MNKYRDPAKAGKINYMNLHYDILSFNKINKKKEAQKLPRNETIFLGEVTLILSHSCRARVQVYHKHFY